MKTYALLVGIDRYDQPQWTIDGPCRNALDVADWLTDPDTGMDAADITMFLATATDALEPRITALTDHGVTVYRDATEPTIDTYCRTQLQAGREPKSTLLVFWSGHGATNAAQDRMFFCRDYRSENLDDRVVNGMNLLNRLRGSAYSSFARQVFLADVCGVYSSVPVPDGSDKRLLPDLVEQLSYFATPEGEYARTEFGSGEFTTSILGVLRGFANWHTDLRGLNAALTNALESFRGPPFRVNSLSPFGQDKERVFGARAPDKGNELFHSAMLLLDPLDIPEVSLARQYQATVDDLGEPGLYVAQGLEGMVHELSKMVRPYGLIQFVMRLGQRDAIDQSDELKDTRQQAVDTWLNDSDHPNTVSDLRKKLNVESQRRILCIEVDHDKSTGVINSYLPYLLRNDYVFVPGRTCEKVLVEGWDELESSLQGFFKEFLDIDDSLCNVDVHFLADPPLFDHPFHQIKATPGGDPIGEQAVVLVRYRTRLHSSNQTIKELWEACARTVRGVTAKELHWVRIGPEDDVLPENVTPCYAGFALPTGYNARACELEKRLVRRILKLGAPYLYLPHTAPQAGDWESVKQELNAWLCEVTSLDLVPYSVLKRRMRGNPHAGTATILWDDPLLNPFTTTAGVGTE